MTPRRVAPGETGLPGGRAGPGVRQVGSKAFWSGRAGARSQPAGEHGSGEAHLRPPAGPACGPGASRPFGPFALVRPLLSAEGREPVAFCSGKVGVSSERHPLSLALWSHTYSERTAPATWLAMA